MPKGKYQGNRHIRFTATSNETIAIFRRTVRQAPKQEVGRHEAHRNNTTICARKGFSMRNAGEQARNGGTARVVPHHTPPADTPTSEVTSTQQTNT